MSGSVRIWKFVSAALFIVAVVSTLILFDVLPRPGFLPKLTPVRSTVRADGFEAFEGIAFAREFSERFQTFDSRSFKVSQVATAFLLDDESRAKRIAEIERLEEKIERSDVSQRARLMSLIKLGSSDDRFRADLDVELVERASGKNARSDFRTRLEFELDRVDRSAQNPWGFRVRALKQEVLQQEALRPSEDKSGTSPVFYLRPGVATLVRLPCFIENVELPKGTSVRVKLTTFDISELQLKTERPLATEQSIRAICRDRAFTLKVMSENQTGDPLVVLKSLTMANAVPLPAANGTGRKVRSKTAVEKSIEDQLGFIIEE